MLIRLILINFKNIFSVIYSVSIYLYSMINLLVFDHLNKYNILNFIRYFLYFNKIDAEVNVTVVSKRI